MVETEGEGTMNASMVADNSSSVLVPGGGDEPKGFGRLAGDGTASVPCGDDESDIPPPTAEQLRIQRWVLYE